MSSGESWRPPEGLTIRTFGTFGTLISFEGIFSYFYESEVVLPHYSDHVYLLSEKKQNKLSSGSHAGQTMTHHVEKTKLCGKTTKN